MTTEITRATTRLADALYALAQAGSIPDATALSISWCASTLTMPKR